ncbi:MAG: glutamate-cysteine ligase family protein [archaeon]
MKIGIEEEFLVVDPETLFYEPGALRLANALVYRDIKYLKKSNIELPLNSNMLERPLSDFKKAFCVIEIKTAPHHDIKGLKKEIQEHRSNLVEVARENGLILLPAGVHPMHSPDNTVPDNCASLHIHLENESEDYYQRLLCTIPFLISVSVNSPFYGGKQKAMSSRSLISPHMGLPKNRYSRTSDLIINKSLNTVEVRTLDTQITLDDTMGIVEMVKTIAENDIFDDPDMSEERYVSERRRAVKKGRGSVPISKEKHDVLLHSGPHARLLLNKKSGAKWQIDVRKKHGLSSVVTSLWSSLQSNKRTVKTTSKGISESNGWGDLLYAVPYSPFLFLEKYKKYHQDLAYLDEYEDKVEELF